MSDARPLSRATIPPPGDGGPALNTDELVAVSVLGQIAHPVGHASPYRIGYDGVPRVLPGTGGIVLNRRIGDLCVGLAGDHIEPGVALHNNGREVVGPRDGPNNALITYACVGNAARVISGPCSGKLGLVTGKHGGVNHVLVDFPREVLLRLRIGDRLQIVSHGLGLRLPDHPRLELLNCSPRLLRRWGLVERDGALQVPVTHLVPSRLMGSGLGEHGLARRLRHPAGRPRDPRALPAGQPALWGHGRDHRRRHAARAELPCGAGHDRRDRARRQHGERARAGGDAAYHRTGAAAAAARGRAREPGGDHGGAARRAAARAADARGVGPAAALRAAVGAAGPGVPAMSRPGRRRARWRARPDRFRQRVLFIADERRSRRGTYSVRDGASGPSREQRH